MYRRNPGIGLTSLFDQMLPIHILTGHTFGGLRDGLIRPGRDGVALLDGIANLDAYRRDGNLHIHIDMPGVLDEDLHVEVVGQRIVITGERTYTPEPGDEVLVTERTHGKITRTITFGHVIDPANVQARLDRGVLHLSILESGAHTTTRIAVQAGTPPTPSQDPR